jgi:hypothetical protein
MTNPFADIEVMPGKTTYHKVWVVFVGDELKGICLCEPLLDERAERVLVAVNRPEPRTLEERVATLEKAVLKHE